LDKLQSEKPRVAKQAQENKLAAMPVPQAGEFMSVPKRKDQQMQAKLGSEPADGVGNGVYSDFLHQWCENLQAVYQVVPFDDCVPQFAVGYYNGHITDMQPINSCAATVERSFTAAMDQAVRPPMPTSFGGQQITFIFFLPTRR
jgi:hypothetical protein